MTEEKRDCPGCGRREIRIDSGKWSRHKEQESPGGDRRKRPWCRMSGKEAGDLTAMDEVLAIAKDLLVAGGLLQVDKIREIEDDLKAAFLVKYGLHPEEAVLAYEDMYGEGFRARVVRRLDEVCEHCGRGALDPTQYVEAPEDSANDL